MYLHRSRATPAGVAAYKRSGALVYRRSATALAAAT
jgi:hypothetical protein